MAAIRPPTVWGPNDTSVVAKFAAAAAEGRFAWIADGRYPTSTGYVEKVGEGLVLAATADADKVRGEAYLVTDGAAITFRTFLTRLLEARGRSPGDQSLSRCRQSPRRDDRPGLAMAVTGEPAPITATYVSLFGLPHTIDVSKAHRGLGYTPPMDRDEGFELVREAHGAS